MTKEKKNNDYFDDYTKELKAYAELERTYQELHKMYVEQTDELFGLQKKVSSLERELATVQRELARAKSGGRHKDYEKEAKIQLYKHEHPEASIRTIAKAIGCSTTTVQNALKTIKRDEDGTLSIMNIPRDKKKLEQIIDGLLTAIEQDTNDKDKQIHKQSLRIYQRAFEELDTKKGKQKG